MPDTINNFLSGISLSVTGDYAVEESSHLPWSTGWCVVYIDDAASLSFAHNSRNVVGEPNGGSEYVPALSDEGQIVYKIDGDQAWEYQITSWDQYSSPFAFASLNYGMFGDVGTSVVGTTGGNGVDYTTGTVSERLAKKETHYYRGILDSSGDEWHTITVADDDSAEITGGDGEFEGSDGKVFYFVVNPTTPAIKIQEDTGEFYTTPPKKYFVPRIYDQTTYFDGTVDFTLTDISGGNISYEINSGGVVNVGASSVVLDETDFSNGSNTLEYWLTATPGVKKTRMIVKAPSFPSAGESHGHRFWGGVDNYDNELKAKLPGNYWIGQWDNNSHTEADYTSGERWGNWPAGQDAMVALRYGIDVGTEHIHASDTKSFAYFAKLGLLASSGGLDPVSGECSTSGTPVPTRELFLRGYNDIEEYAKEAVAYDIIAGFYRSDQGFADGMTAIEDYIIRDRFAKYIHYTTLSLAGMAGGLAFDALDEGGMWDTAHRVGGMIWAAAMPGYSSEIYGTSGFSGFSTTTYTDAPFDSDEYTWYELFYTDPIGTLNGYPNLHKHFGYGDSDEYNMTSGGDWVPRGGYSTLNNMGYNMCIYGNLLALFATTRAKANFQAVLAEGWAGTLDSLAGEPNSQPPLTDMFRSWAPLQNNWFPDYANARSTMEALQISEPSNPESTGKQMQNSDVFGIIWYDHNYPALNGWDDQTAMTNPDLTTTQPQAALDQIKADCDTLNGRGNGTAVITASDLTNPAKTNVSEIAVQKTNQDNLNTDNSLGLTLTVPSGDFVDQFQDLYVNNVAIEAALP
jgi:hypothetical protein